MCMNITIQDMYIEGLQIVGCKCGEQLIALSPFCHQTSNMYVGKHNNRFTAPSNRQSTYQHYWIETISIQINLQESDPQ